MWSDRCGSCSEGGGEIEIFVELMSALRICRVACCVLRVFDETVYFGDGTFPHHDAMVARRDNLSEEPVSPRASVADALWNPRQPHFQR